MIAEIQETILCHACWPHGKAPHELCPHEVHVARHPQSLPQRIDQTVVPCAGGDAPVVQLLLKADAAAMKGHTHLAEVRHMVPELRVLMGVTASAVEGASWISA